MKFTPETLLQIYLDGAFTDEAQAEFDRLMRQDPAFSEQVTRAVAERLGSVPDSVVDGISDRLDGKMRDLWQRHKPSPVRRWAKPLFQGLGAVLLAAGLYTGGRQLVARVHFTAGSNATRQSTRTLQAPEESRPSLTFSTDEEGTGGTDAPQRQSTGSKPRTGDGSQVQATISGVGSKAQDHPENSTAAAAAAVSRGAPGDRGKALSTGSSSPLPPALSSAANQQKGRANGVPSPGSVTAYSTRKVGPLTQEGTSLRVAIETEKTRKVSVTLLEPTGLLVRHLYEGVLPAGEHYVDWDGKDDAGNQVLPGDYTVVLDLGDKKMSGILKVLPNP